MAVIKKLKAVKIEQNHLLGIQDLSFSQVNEILKQAKTFIALNKSSSKKILKICNNKPVSLEVFADEYLEMKKQNGYSQEEIDRKRYSLEGVLVPLTASWNEQIIKDTGFKYVDCFWRWMNFAGWVAIK